MIWLSVILLLAGVFLSAFFSGNETGFYRASRVRLVMDGLDGDSISRYLLKFANNPTLFVATTLVGNNVANYLTSLAIVLLTRAIYVNDAGLAEMLAPILFSPLLFVYGELLPKHLFYNAPNRLLRRGGPLFLLFTLLFAPVAFILWGMARLLEKTLGKSPDKVRLMLARQELQEVLVEGQQAGILHPTQRHLGQNFFLVASNPVRSVCTPLNKALPLPIGTENRLAIRHARKHEMADIPLYETNRNRIVGYVRTIDLLLANQPNETIAQACPMIEIRQDEVLGEALLTMQSKRETVARVTRDDGQTVGLLSIDQLTEPLLKGPLGSFQR
ncbi:MAG: CNNM domain-containing protein [Planctomycetota bacterium]|nr:CNNM domain-containing protein [Planctomycetota bacterium]